MTGLLPHKTRIDVVLLLDLDPLLSDFQSQDIIIERWDSQIRNDSFSNTLRKQLTP